MQSPALPLLEFPELADSPIHAALSLRSPRLPVAYDKMVAIDALMPLLSRVLVQRAPNRLLVTAEQTHGKELAIIHADVPPMPVPIVDGLLTARNDIVLGVAVADCCPVWLWTPDGSAVAIVHAGRKGTEAGIAAAAANLLATHSGHPVDSLGAFFGPCIRPPCYEIDIPALLHAQLAAAGVKDRRDCQLNTATDLARFYSYRTEKGLTGRMMALAWID